MAPTARRLRGRNVSHPRGVRAVPRNRSPVRVGRLGRSARPERGDPIEELPERARLAELNRGGRVARHPLLKRTRREVLLAAEPPRIGERGLLFVRTNITRGRSERRKSRGARRSSARRSARAGVRDEQSRLARPARRVARTTPDHDGRSGCERERHDEHAPRLTRRTPREAPRRSRAGRHGETTRTAHRNRAELTRAAGARGGLAGLAALGERGAGSGPRALGDGRGGGTLVRPNGTNHSRAPRRKARRGDALDRRDRAPRDGVHGRVARGLPDVRVLDGGLLSWPRRRGNCRADQRDAPFGPRARPLLRPRVEDRQAFDRRRRGQGEPLPGAARRRVRRSGPDGERPRARTHRWNARQARSDPGLPDRHRGRPIRRDRRPRRHLHDRTDARDRPGRQARIYALRGT